MPTGGENHPRTNEEKRMRKQCYYCWVRVVSIAKLKSLGPIVILHSGRPPTAKAMSVDRTTEADQDAWFADELAYGDPKAEALFDYGPAYRSRGLALAWLATRRGKAWKNQAENYMLMTFELDPGEQKE
jgi:hypothetical protein